MVANTDMPKKPKRALSNEAKCPACDAMLMGNVESLLVHFDETHKRKPTEAEIFRFRSYKKKDLKSSRHKVKCLENPIEVGSKPPALGIALNTNSPGKKGGKRAKRTQATSFFQKMDALNALIDKGGEVAKDAAVAKNKLAYQAESESDRSQRKKSKPNLLDSSARLPGSFESGKRR